MIDPLRSLALGLLTVTLLAACNESEVVPEPAPTPQAHVRPPAGAARAEAAVMLSEAPDIVELPPDIVASPLTAPFVSMMTLEEVVPLTGESPFQVDMNRKTPQRGTCPGQHFIKLTVRRFTHLGHYGTVQMNFYDGMLTSTRFMTGDPASYRDALAAEYDIEIVGRGPVYIPPATRVATPVMGNRSPLLEDVRLQKRVDSIERACRYQLQQERLAATAEADAGD